MPNQTARPTVPLRVAAYARVSTLNQLLEHDGSVDTQLQTIRHRAAYERTRAENAATGARPWVIACEYREEGKSGKDVDRPQLQRLLADVRAGQIDLVAVTKIDRITRSLIDFYDLYNQFEAQGVAFVSLGDNVDGSTATGRAMLKLTLVFAELERERTSERTREKIEARRVTGKWFGGPVPLGYKVDPKDKTTLVFDDADRAAQIVRDLFDVYVNHVRSVRGVVRHLYQKEFKRPKRVTSKGKVIGGRPFTVQSTIHILSNPVYVAKRKLPDGSTINCTWPPLIEQELFDGAQELLAQNSERRPHGRATSFVFLLEGLLRCSCGAMLSRYSANGRRGKTYYYYRCTRRARTANQACKARDLPVEPVEEYVLGKLSEYAVDPVAIARAVHEGNAGRDTDATKLDEALREKRAARAQQAKAIAKLVDAVEEGGEVAPLLERLAERREADHHLQSEIDDLQTRRHELERETVAIENVVKGFAELSGLLKDTTTRSSRERVRGLLRAVVDVIDWYWDPEGDSGEAVVQMFPLKPGFWAERHVDVNREGGGSLGRPMRLRRLDSNQRPGD